MKSDKSSDGYFLGIGVFPPGFFVVLRASPSLPESYSSYDSRTVSTSDGGEFGFRGNKPLGIRFICLQVAVVRLPLFMKMESSSSRDGAASLRDWESFPERTFGFGRGRGGMIG